MELQPEMTSAGGSYPLLMGELITLDGPLETAHAHIDDDRYDYDMGLCGTAGQPKLELVLSDQLRRCSCSIPLRMFD